MIQLPKVKDYKVLDRVTLENMTFEIASGDMHVGPRAWVSVELGGLTYGGSINLLIALNESIQRPPSLIIVFRGIDGEDAPIGWQIEDSATCMNSRLPMIKREAIPPIMFKITDTIVRMLAMRGIPGYVQHAKDLH